MQMSEKLQHSKPNDMADAEWAARLELAAAYRVFHFLGWTELIFNHITLRVPGPECHYLINPFGLNYEEVTASNLVKVALDGQIIGDSRWGINRAGFVIHSAIHAHREDAHCVMHTHLLCNHPSYVVDASLDDIRRLAGMGVYCEHSMCMFVPGSKFHFYQPAELDAMIKAATPEQTILGSDLGQIGNPRLVDGFRNVIETCLDLGYSESQVRSMVSGNAVALMGL